MNLRLSAMSQASIIALLCNQCMQILTKIDMQLKERKSTKTSHLSIENQRQIRVKIDKFLLFYEF